MAEFKDLIQAADWKKEKHVPAIEISGAIGEGSILDVKVSVGKEIPHPNTTAHHIRWVEVYFLPDGEKFPCEIARCEFNSHGESGKGADTSTIYSHPEVSIKLKTQRPGTVLASSYCNIHGLWQNSKDIK